MRQRVKCILNLMIMVNYIIKCYNFINDIWAVAANIVGVWLKMDIKKLQKNYIKEYKKIPC